MAIAVAVGCLPAVAVACGDGDGGGDEDAIREVLRTVEKSWADQDYDTFASVHTEDGLRAELGDAGDIETEEGRRQVFDEITAEERTVIHAIRAIDVEGEAATAQIEVYNEGRDAPPASAVIIGVGLDFVKQDGEWKVDGIELGGSPEVPEGADVVAVQANEFAFSLEKAEFHGGRIALKVENVGQQLHHVVIEKAPEDFDIEEALQSDEPPDLVRLGGTPPWGAGETATITFTEELEPGRYILLCFMPDTDDPEETPHVLKGMHAEFRVNEPES
jgi:hypothetical protein